MNINLQKLDTIRTGANIFNTLTADRINAIQDAIKELSRGRNVIAGDNIRVTHAGGAVNISATQKKDTTQFRAIQEYAYCAKDMQRQCSYNGRPDYQPYRDLKGIEIPLPRPNNVFDLNCEPNPNPPLNVWENLENTYNVGAEFMDDKGDHFIFTKPGVYEIEFEYTAMHKADACEWNKNTHSFDCLFFPALGNKGVAPVWLQSYQRWDWIQGRNECDGKELRVIHPANAYVQYSIHGKQRIPNDNNVFLEFYDKEKKVGLRGDAGIKYKGDCSYIPTTPDACAFVRDEGTPEGGGCSTSSVVIQYCSLSSSDKHINFNTYKYNLTSVPHICSSSYTFDLLYDPCDTTSILDWDINTIYNPGDWVRRNGEFFINTQTTNTTEPLPNDDIFWSKQDPCANNYDVAVCSGSSVTTLYLDGNVEADISGSINVPTCELVGYKTCPGATVWSFTQFNNQRVHYDQNKITKIGENETVIGGELEFDVPVSLTKTEKSCVHIVNDYVLSSSTDRQISFENNLQEHSYNCGGYEGKIDVDITIPTALVPTTKTVHYQYPHFSTSTVTCGGATVDVNVEDTTINIPTTIASTQRDTVKKWTAGTDTVYYDTVNNDGDVVIQKYSQSTNKCAGGTLSGLSFEATLDIPVDLKEGVKQIIGQVYMPEYTTESESVITACPTFSSWDVVNNVIPVKGTVTDAATGTINLNVPTSLTPTTTTENITIAVPRIQKTTITVPQVVSTVTESVTTGITESAASALTGLDVTTSTEEEAFGGTISVNVPTSLEVGETTVGVDITTDKINTESFVLVTNVTGTNTTLSIPTISSGMTSASDCCYCDCDEEESGG